MRLYTRIMHYSSHIHIYIYPWYEAYRGGWRVLLVAWLRLAIPSDIWDWPALSGQSSGADLRNVANHVRVALIACITAMLLPHPPHPHPHSHTHIAIQFFWWASFWTRVSMICDGTYLAKADTDLVAVAVELSYQCISLCLFDVVLHPSNI